MKVYLKILSIAVATQLVGFILTYTFDTIVQGNNVSRIIPIFIGLASVVVSMILSLFFVCKWCSTKRKAFVTYLLLPTNYTLLILLVFVVQFVEKILSILENIPYNFG